jgi:hypothetical protein
MRSMVSSFAVQSFLPWLPLGRVLARRPAQRGGRAPGVATERAATADARSSASCGEAPDSSASMTPASRASPAPTVSTTAAGRAGTDHVPSAAIHDEPAGLVWDDAGLFVVKYGFHTYGFESRTGALRWSHRSASPVIALFGSPRLAHLLVQSEIETLALEPDGTVGWRIAHSDVVSEAVLVGGRLVLTSFAGLVSSIDPATGRAAE